MAKPNSTSVHIVPAAAGAEEHNRRTKRLDYVRSELSARNQIWESPDFRSVTESIARARSVYRDKTGQTMQAKATPIREGVAVISDDTTMAQLREFCSKCQERWGIKALAIYTHLDEGHEIEGEWHANRHAHIIWQWYSDESGKSCKLSKKDTAEMQTILADCLNMERGKSSDREHLNAIQYKNQAEEQRSRELATKNKKLTEQQQDKERQVAELEKKIREGKVTRAVVAAEIKALGLTKAVGERLMSLMGQSTADKELRDLRPKYEVLGQELKAVREENEQLKAKIQETQAVAKYQVQQAQMAEKEARQDVKAWERTMQPLKWLLLAWNQLQALAENKYGNIFHPHIQDAITKLRDMFRIPSTERAAGHLVDTCPYLSEKQKDEVWPEVKKDVEIIDNWERRQGLHR